MENASKALLIAGSVLIAILLIAFGIRVFSSTSGTTDEVKSTMNATEIATFNSKFTAYAGTNKSASQARSLANVVIANNATNKLHKVKFNTKETANDITSEASMLSGSGTISVNIEQSTGLVVSVSFVNIIN